MLRFLSPRARCSIIASVNKGTQKRRNKKSPKLGTNIRDVTVSRFQKYTLIKTVNIFCDFYRQYFRILLKFFLSFVKDSKNNLMFLAVWKLSSLSRYLLPRNSLVHARIGAQTKTLEYSRTHIFSLLFFCIVYLLLGVCVCSEGTCCVA